MSHDATMIQAEKGHHPSLSWHFKSWQQVSSTEAQSQQLNQSAYRMFTPGLDLSFDKGGIASHSRFNHVRQYNKDKPQKFRFDFFVLCNNSPEKYVILHCDVYQGKNSEDIGILEEIRSLTIY